MLQMVDQDDGTSLLQLPKVAEGCGQDLAPEVEEHGVNNLDSSGDALSFMQKGVDKFGVLLQKLLGLLEKMGQPHAGVRAGFLMSMLADIQRPGPHVSAVVVEKMDRLQALLLSFDEGAPHDTSDEDRDWCLRQWEVLRPTLLDRKREKTEGGHEDDQRASSSSVIVCIEDSQESVHEGGIQVAVFSDGSTRPLTKEEIEEVAYNEELERSAAKMEFKADEQRWLEYKAQCLREEENATMQEALDANEDPESHTHKKAKVMVQVEGEGGRLVRSEVFNLVVKDGEALTYKIMVQPRDDPEVRRLRRQQAAREGDTDLEPSSNVSEASAETVPVNERGQALPEPPVVPDEELQKFMKTPEGKEYYQRWLKGDITCKMVRERSGCGLLAKFFGCKTDEEEEQKLLQEALRMEARLSQRKSRESLHAGHGDDQGQEVLPSHAAGTGVMAPSSWPSYTLRAEPAATISLESQESDDAQGSGLVAVADVPAAEFSISHEENQAELMFAIAAGDVPAEAEATANSMAEGIAESTEGGTGNSGNGAVEGHAAESSEHNKNTMGGRSGSDDRTTNSTEGLVQTNLRSWLA